jgi:hypothetical protein
MKPDAAVLAAPALPQVNLLPDDIRRARTLGTVKRWLGLGVGLTALSVGLVAGLAHLQTQAAQSELAQADAEAAGLLAQQRPFAQVVPVRSELESMRAARSFGLAQEISWSDYLGAISAVTPPGVGISSLEYVGATPLAVAPASADPTIPAGVGALTFRAVADDLPDTAAWADALEALPGLRDVRVSTAARADEDGASRYDLTGTVQVDQGALAHRFDSQPEGDS